MALNTNQHYFDISIQNPEALDLRYAHIAWDPNLDLYIETTKQIKELLATIKQLKAHGRNADDFYEELYAIFIKRIASKNELNCFVNACDCSTGVLKAEWADNNKQLFINIVDLYLQYRDFTDQTPREWVQALIDKGASRAGGTVGENKLVEIAQNAGFVLVDNWDNFIANGKVVAVFKKGVFDRRRILENLGVDLQFNAQDKMLDVILKNGDTYVFIEAKHMKECGGSQDKQIKELIDIIRTDTNNDNVKYVAFLDGFYSNLLLKDIRNPIDKDAKTPNQQRDINTALAANSNSYWLNTAGFNKFVHDFVQD